MSAEPVLVCLCVDSRLERAGEFIRKFLETEFAVPHSIADMKEAMACEALDADKEGSSEVTQLVATAADDKYGRMVARMNTTKSKLRSVKKKPKRRERHLLKSKEDLESAKARSDELAQAEKEPSQSTKDLSFPCHK